jgi:hypothetical protein
MPYDSKKEKQGKIEIATLLREAVAQEPTALELQQMEQEIAQENAMMEENSESEEGSEEEPEEGSEEESEED